MLPSASKEKFLVLNMGPTGTTGRLLSLDSSRAISLKKQSVGWLLKHAERLSPYSFLPKIVLAVESQLVYSHVVHVLLSRKNWQEPLRTIELETLLHKELVSLLNKQRSQAAAYLKTDELHAVCVSAQVLYMRLDGEESIHPMGTPVRELDIVIRLTFARRELFEKWKNFFKNPQRFFLVDQAQAHLGLLRRAYENPFSLILLNGDTTDIHHFDSFPAAHKHNRLHWSVAQLHKALEDKFGLVTAQSIERVCLSYLRRETSKGISQKLERLSKPHIESLLKELLRHTPKDKSRALYFVSSSPLPVDLSKQRMPVSLREFPTTEVLQLLGFSCKGTLPFDATATLAPFLEFYYYRSDSPINYWLQRRLHWLTPP